MNYSIVQEGHLTDIIYQFTIQEPMRPLIGDVIQIPGYYNQQWKITRSIPATDPTTGAVTFVVESMDDLRTEFKYDTFDQYYLRTLKKGGGDLYLLRPKDLGDNFNNW